jgi:ABC-2 type transport system ATP-binding protein
VLTTHYLEEAQQLCSRIAMMRDGRIVALDSTEKLLAAFSERVLRVKLEDCALPEALAAGAADEGGGWWRLPGVGRGARGDALARLRQSGATVASLEVSEPELESVREDHAARGGR